MSATVFFSWQSDHPTREGRNFIQKCLQDALKNLSRDIEFQQAVREDLQVDSDTTNVPGSPKIFQTILNKVQKATIFVPDFTFVATRPNGHPVPNPNVLIEYGYALKCLGEHQIVAVMNVAHGAPQRDTMPFDLMEHRYPILYDLPKEADDQTRNFQRAELTKKFESALRTFFESDEYKHSLPTVAPIAYREPKEGKARFREKGDPIGVRTNVLAHIIGAREDKVFLKEGPSMWLRVGPQSPIAKALKIKDIETHANRLALLPFYEPGGSIGGVRGPDGCGFFNEFGAEPTPSLVYVFTDGEVWSINTFYLAVKRDLIYFEEQKIVKSLQDCVAFLSGLGIPGPYRWVAGFEGIRERYLRENIFGMKSGLCQLDVIESEGTFRAGDDAQLTIEPFFEKVFDQCGVDRPSKDPVK